MFKNICLILVFSVLFANANENNDKNNLWEALKTDNHFAMIRHALAPGFGDPSNFKIDVRSTQRNLSNKGISQAKHIGDMFRKNGINEAEVYSSQWFRCQDTAKNINLAKVRINQGLNSFFENHADEKETVRYLNSWLKNKKINKPLLLVTHQVNISTLTGYYPSSGEIVVVKKEDDNSFKVVGTINTFSL